MLLMIEPGDRAVEPVQRLRVAKGTAGAIDVRQGQLLKVMAHETGATAALFGFVKDDPSIFLSVHHTRVFNNSYLLGLGMRLVTNRRRPLMVLGKDTVGSHDMLMPASTTAYLRARGMGDQSGSVEAVREQLANRALNPSRLPDPVNLFMNVQVHQDGRLEPRPNAVAAGDHAIFRVLRDCVFIVSACATGIDGNDQGGSLEISAAEDLSEL